MWASFRWPDLIIELWPDPLYTEPLIAGRPWFKHCAFCGLDDAGEHYDGCTWRRIIEAHLAADWYEAEEAAHREAEERAPVWSDAPSFTYFHGTDRVHRRAGRARAERGSALR
jgi:hypothetical protein